jgi:RHH-type proline utilization regulon transcriptional repressor/proline dehydrogenase/delta 1-pyrroline-5-carboxylate dehydrogenase
MLQSSDAELELAIQRIGRALAERTARQTPTILDARWWSGTVLQWAMKDEQFKVQLFRFIDVLPSLKSDAQLLQLAEEYFAETKLLTTPMQWGLRALSETRLGTRLSAKSLRHQIDQMARTFIAGATVEDALPVLKRSWSEGRGFSVDLLGEATVSEIEADRYRDRCLEALRRLHEATADWPAVPLLERDHLGSLPKVHLSVKLSALYSQLDPIDPEDSYRVVAGRLRPILDLAVTMPAAITFDMEQAELKELTLTIFTRLLSEQPYRSYPHGGIALQAYLKDTASDTERLVTWLRQRGVPITVRLVKGAYWDSDTIRYQQRGWPVPVFQSKAETDASYERLTRTLLAHADLVRPAIGTHNLRSLVHAEAAFQATGLPPNACEYQMIFGMAESLQAVVVEAGRRVRTYTPVGELIPGMAYLVRRLLENTSNESFLRKEYAEAEPIDVLLAQPIPQSGPAGADVLRDGGGSGESDARFVNEPHTDFSKEASRSAMAQAVRTVRAQLGQSRHGPGSVSRSGSDLISYNPADPDEVVGRIRAATPADAARAVESALAAFRTWRSTSPEGRAGVLQRAAAIMRRRRFELAAWEIFETGKPWREADADVAEAIDFLEFYAGEMRRLGRPRRLGDEPGELNHLLLSPRGLVAVISPWNFPLAIPTGMVSAALVTGNAVLFKPSERAPIIGHLLVETLAEAGAPEGALQFLPGGPDVGQALVDHPEVHAVAFTGSKEVGLRILAQAARSVPGQRHVKHVIAEMGGKNAIIVDETADLDEAVTGVMASFTGYQGQKCSACSRAIVLNPVHDIFLQRLAEAVMSLPIGPPEQPGTRMGPLIDERAREKVRGYVEIGRREGRAVVERSVDRKGYFQGPAIFADIQPHHRLAQEEIFGPVLAVIRAKDFQEALDFANATPYALTGGLYSRSPANILAARERFDVGNLYINRPITGALVGRQPFGGHRLSGVGAKAGGEDYLSQFMVARVVSENTLRRGFAPAE